MASNFAMFLFLFLLICLILNPSQYIRAGAALGRAQLYEHRVPGRDQTREP